ncbi:MAG: XrtA/PEP-CTERM system histidine kinase PrsK [Thalassotalea sp.]
MALVGFLGYIFSSIAFLIFILLLLAARNKTLAGRLVLSAILVSTIANAMAAFQLQQQFSIKYVLIFEALKLLLWPMLIICTRDSITSFRTLIKHKYTKQYIMYWFVFLAISWLSVFYFEDGTRYLFMFFLVFNLWQIVLLEQLYRNASNKSKWALWPLVVALGSASVFEFVMYAQAYMVNQLEYLLWYIRPLIMLISIPFLLISTRRMKDWSVNVFVSRNVVFYSSMLLIAGGYLLVMALAGYVINFIGGEWGRVLTITFLVLASVVLFALIITDTIRRRVKVFIAKNFFANKYEYRDEWLDLIEKIETTSAESYYQMATNIMMSKLSLDSGSILKKVNSTNFQVKYSQGLNFDPALFQQLLKLATFCHKKGWIVDMKEYAKTPNLYDDLALDLAIFEQQKINIIVPIFIGKALYGMFVLAGNEEVKPLNWEDRDLLFAISKQLGNFISLHEANDRIAESKQFDAFNRMSAFLVHDLKNVQAQLGLINDNAVKHRNNPAFVDDVFETVESATNRLDKMLTQLRNKQAEQSTTKKIDIVPVVGKVVEQRNVNKPAVTFTAIDQCVLSVDAESLHSVLNHLIQNAQEATAQDGWIKVDVTSTDIDVVITITDNGTGMSEEFIKTRLFKPFDTTKGNAGMGIGVFEAKQFFEGNAGSLTVESVEHEGTTFILMLPLNPSYKG